ncbi:MAG: Glutamate--tRNA ligase mitochondrial [Piccolia ochrophora]|nr:MAG: Glutamate--tRNA ligase mitochondrial [Piccolia ochrophora]
MTITPASGLSLYRGFWICRYCSTQIRATSKIRHQSTTSGASAIPIPSGARTRFAPSPTGYLHLGSLRTALFNFLLAKASGGQFILRIEDTDQKRTIADAQSRLLEDLRWAGVHWDEGPEAGGAHGPYLQSQRLDIYRKHADDLLRSGNAYRCFCSAKRLRLVAEERRKFGLPAEYDRTCAEIPASESEYRAAEGKAHVVRLKSRIKYAPFRDLAIGTVKTGFNKIHRDGAPAHDDQVLLKTDGFPTYHLANVVDDHLMNISHVVRASEWLSSTPLHLHLYSAFGWKPPEFAHVSILTDSKHKKLSKRNVTADNQNWEIAEYRDSGVLPSALVNFVSLLGWSHSRGRDVMTMNDLIQAFNMKFTKGDTVVTFPKLWFLQGQHAVRVAEKGGDEFEQLLDHFSSYIRPRLAEAPLNAILQKRSFRSYLSTVLRLDAPKLTNTASFLARNAYFFGPPHPRVSYTPPATDPIPAPDLARHSAVFQTITADAWTAKDIVNAIKNATVEATGISDSVMNGDESGKFKAKRKAWNGQFYHYLRWALANASQGPPVAATMEALGRDVCLERLEEAKKMLEEQSVEEAGGDGSKKAFQTT